MVTESFDEILYELTENITGNDTLENLLQNSLAKTNLDTVGYCDASTGFHSEYLNDLMKSGLNSESKDTEGQTLLHHAAIHQIDESLVSLEKKIVSSTGIDFNPMREDATQFDYTSLELSQPIFFISGLPEIGEMLANNVISRIMSIPDLKVSPIFVFTGSHVMRKGSRDKSKWGWGQVIEHFKLDVIKTITLPTYWTLDQLIDTPFIFTKAVI